MNREVEQVTFKLNRHMTKEASRKTREAPPPEMPQQHQLTPPSKPPRPEMIEDTTCTAFTRSLWPIFVLLQIIAFKLLFVIML
eukprot:jgi/Psemu1/13046/gm1.13046_g